MPHIDLNCDLGESAERFQNGHDFALLAVITSANIACGYHAGEHNIMAGVVAAAAARGVGIGAHPGLRDAEGFGRRVIATTPWDAYNAVVYQIGALAAFARLHGVSIQHVKPHGALYWMAEAGDGMAEAIARAVRDVEPLSILVGQAGGRLVRAGGELGLRVAHEAFADRTYRADGLLTPRGEPGALIEDPDEAARRMVKLVHENVLAAADGTELAIHADTLCIHGDGAMALAVASRVRTALKASGVSIRRLGES